MLLAVFVLALPVGCADHIPPTTLTDAEIALHMQCHDKHGLTAYARGNRTWVTCYKVGKKLTKIWSVRLLTGEDADAAIDALRGKK
jgi:hypothetical protein